MSEMPVFVKIDEYKETLEVIELLKSKIAQAQSVLQRINQLRDQEAAELDSWRERLTDVEDKVAQIDHVLLQPEQV